MNVTVRMAGPEDRENFTKWAFSTKDNLFDPTILSYPNLRILAVESDDKVLMYFPFQLVFQGESLALNPEANKKELAYGFRKLDTAFRELAKPYGIRELFFACAEPSFVTFAARHGWNLVRTAYLKSKVKP
jgi:hypothetical protein